ncbi:MAG: hypothetical protein Q9M36_02725 [Sulfurovum sp.]|nr:hypothetical protein [Sulfurovum sp.]
MAKNKKVSFNMEEGIFEKIKVYTSARDIQMSDFFRSAAVEKLERDYNAMTIFIMWRGNIKKFNINRNDYSLIIWEASEEMIENVGAVSQGKIKDKISTEEMLYGTKIITKPQELENIFKNLSNLPNNEKPSIEFYTKEKYENKKDWDLDFMDEISLNAFD